jgi:hypothetical protein
MSLNADNAGSLVARELLPAVSASNTAGATTSTSGGYADTQDLEGELAVVVNCGAVTGSVTVKLQSASDANGTGAADISGAVASAISSANGTAIITIPKNAMTARYLGIVGTVVTGPVLISATLIGSKKYS